MPLSVWEISARIFFPLRFITAPLCFLSSSSLFARVTSPAFVMDFSACRFSIYDKGMRLVFSFFFFSSLETQSNVDAHSRGISFRSLLRLLLWRYLVLFSFCVLKKNPKYKVTQRSAQQNISQMPGTRLKVKELGKRRGWALATSVLFHTVAVDF